MSNLKSDLSEKRGRNTNKTNITQNVRPWTAVYDICISKLPKKKSEDKIDTTSNNNNNTPNVEGQNICCRAFVLFEFDAKRSQTK